MIIIFHQIPTVQYVPVHLSQVIDGIGEGLQRRGCCIRAIEQTITGNASWINIIKFKYGDKNRI